MAAGGIPLQKTTLRNLNTNMENVLVVGVIIGKQRPRKFLSKTDMNFNNFLAVWNFTLRDSSSDYINVSFWGSTEVVFQANDKYQTGHVVELINPRIMVRSINDYGEQFRPMVTSPYTLSLNERSAITLHAGPWEEYLKLLSYPTKPLAGYLPLRDVNNSGATITDTYVDVLAVVKGIGNVRTVSTRNNETMQVRTIEIFDHTSSGVKLDIWEPDIIKRSEKWKPRKTALFITDLKIQWSYFQRQHVLKFTCRSILTENPQGKDVTKLLEYAETAPIETFQIVDQLLTDLPDVNTIKDVMSVKQVQDKINLFMTESRLGTQQFTALVFAFVSSLDLDGLTKILFITCAKCKMEIKGTVCENDECPTVFGNEFVQPNITFNIRITLTDHTGTLIGCRFRGQAAEQALGCTAKDFANMSDDEKCMLKWKYLMERCAVKLAVLFIGPQKPVISVMQIALPNVYEIASRLPIH